MKATLTSNAERRLTWDEIKNVPGLYKNTGGHVILLHGNTHPDFPSVPNPAIMIDPDGKIRTAMMEYAPQFTYTRLPAGTVITITV